MRYDEFIRNVQDGAGLTSKEPAEAATRATLEVLSGRLTQQEANDLAAQLPEELKGVLSARAPQLEKLSLDEFVAQVQRIAGIDDRTETERCIRAVMGTLTESVTGGEIADVLSRNSPGVRRPLGASVPVGGLATPRGGSRRR